MVHPYCGIYYSEITVDTQNNFVDLKGIMLNEKKLISKGCIFCDSIYIKFFFWCKKHKIDSQPFSSVWFSSVKFIQCCEKKKKKTLHNSFILKNWNSVSKSPFPLWSQPLLTTVLCLQFLCIWFIWVNSYNVCLFVTGLLM